MLCRRLPGLQLDANDVDMATLVEPYIDIISGVVSGIIAGKIAQIICSIAIDLSIPLFDISEDQKEMLEELESHIRANDNGINRETADALAELPG
jgi:hypothetical protein